MKLSLRQVALAASSLLVTVACSPFHSSKLKAPVGPIDPQSRAYLTDMATKRGEIKPTQTDVSTLPNGMKVYIVSDPSVQQAAVSVRVGSGQYQVAKEYRGLAHYLEHVLFLGSTKYPTPAEFMTFVMSHQGSTNAFTTDEDTNYQASIRNEFFPETVDRLADFFVAPRFDATFVGKELSAIQSEYDKNTQNTMRRIFHLGRMMFDPDHPHAYSFQGNKESLGQMPREAMQKFFNENYSADNMTLVMIGSQPIAELKDLATKTFGRVPKRNYHPKALPSLVEARVRPAQFVRGSITQNKPTLALAYTLPPVTQDYWTTKDYQLIQNLLNDQQEGSLVAVLKNRGWISSLGIFNGEEGVLGAQFMIVTELTPLGYAHWQEIASGILAQIEYLKKIGFKTEVFKNTQRAAELDYLYGSKEVLSQAIELAEALPLVGAMRTPERLHLLAKADPAAYRHALSGLTLDRLDVFLMAADIKGDQKSDYFNISYSMSNLADQDWAKRPQTLTGFTPHVPVVNPYLPQDIAVVSEQDNSPNSVVKTPLMNAVLERDNTFRSPNANLAIKIQYGAGFKANAQDTALNRVLLNYMNLALEGWASGPQQVGYKLAMEPRTNGLSISMAGYSDRMPYFARELVARISTMKIDPALFAVVLENTKRQVANIPNDDATKQAGLIMRSFSNPTGYSDRAEAGLLDAVTLEQLQDFKGRVLASGQVDLFGFGSLTQSQLKDIAADFEAGLGMKAEAPSPVVTALAPKGVTSSYLATRTGDNNVWLNVYELGPNTAENVARAKLIGALSGQPFFEYMRTQKQYGYICYGAALGPARFAAVYFIVQSKVKAEEVAQEGRRWLKEDLLTSIKSMSDAEFNAVKSALVQSLRAPAATFDDKFAPLNNSFMVPDYPSNDQMAGAVQAITQSGLVADMESRLFGSERREFSIYLDSGVMPKVPAGEVLVPSLEDFWKKAERF